MNRRTIAAIAGILLVSILTMAPAWAQQSPFVVTTTTTTTTSTTSTTSTSVLPDEETSTTTTEAPTTTEETTTTTAAAEVAGDVVTRPLPRTGSDLGGPAILGGALTLTGIVLALGARRRRNSFENV